MYTHGFDRAAVILLVLFGSRAWAKYQSVRRDRAALVTPLVDRTVLEAVFAPRARDADDPALLDEMRDTFLHLNREAYAEEFYRLDAQLATLYQTLAPAAQATMRRALLRLVTANDKWLPLVGAKTCAALGLREAAAPLRAQLEMDTSMDKRYRAALEDALQTLSK